MVELQLRITCSFLPPAAFKAKPYLSQTAAESCSHVSGYFMRLFLASLFSFVSMTLWADQPRYRTLFTSANEQFSIKLEQKIWYVQNKRGDTLYSIQDSGYAWMTIFVSNSGERLVIIDDYPNGIGGLRALQFYNKGQQTKSYSFQELVSSGCFCAYSASHVQWALHDFSLSDDEKKFSLATYEFYEYEFDIEGSIIRKNRPEGYKETATIAYGDLFRVRGQKDTYLMRIKVYVTGPKYPKNELQFKAKRLPKRDQQILMITDGVDVTPKRFIVNYIILNRCHEREA